MRFHEAIALALAASAAGGCEGFRGFVGFIGPRDGVAGAGAGGSGSAAASGGAFNGISGMCSYGANGCSPATSDADAGVCSGSGGTGIAVVCADSAGGYCGAWAARLRECGLLGPGCFAECQNFLDAAETCETQCIATATCEAIDNWQCGDGTALIDCLGACVGEMPVHCGDGTTWSYTYRCDGVFDCAAAEDENGCPALATMKCRNVEQRVDLSLWCDGKPDCSDGSDEPPACADAFICDCDLALPAAAVCDGVPDCDDGTDEPSDCVSASCL